VVVVVTVVVMVYGYLNRRSLDQEDWLRARGKKRKPVSKFVGICMILFRTGFFKSKRKASPL